MPDYRYTGQPVVIDAGERPAEAGDSTYEERESIRFGVIAVAVLGVPEYRSVTI